MSAGDWARSFATQAVEGALAEVLAVGAYSADKSELCVRLFRCGDDGQLREMARGSSSPPIEHPSYLCLERRFAFSAPTTTFHAFVVGEADEREGDVALLAFRLDGDGQRYDVEEIARAPSGGWTPCHVSFEPRSGLLAVSNYAAQDQGGSIVFFRPTLAAGSLSLRCVGRRALEHRPTGSSLPAQSNSHGHACLFVDDRYALCCDLGSDAVDLLRLPTGSSDDLDVDVVARALLPAGSGPRHLVLSPTGGHVYVSDEWSVDVAVLKLDVAAQPAALTWCRSFALADAPAPAQPSAIKRFGRHLYVANRRANTVVVFEIDAHDEATLTRLQTVPCGGDWPRDLTVHPSGRFLLVANQLSSAVHVLQRDVATGLLTEPTLAAATPLPACLAFLLDAPTTI